MLGPRVSLNVQKTLKRRPSSMTFLFGVGSSHPTVSRVQIRTSDSRSYYILSLASSINFYPKIDTGLGLALNCALLAFAQLFGLPIGPLLHPWSCFPMCEPSPSHNFVNMHAQTAVADELLRPVAESLPTLIQSDVVSPIGWNRR